MTAKQVADHLDARHAGSGKWMARCPAHDDKFPSLSVREGEGGRTLLRCWAGCSLAAVLKAAGLTVSSLFPAGPPPSSEELKAAAKERERKAAATAKERASRQRLVARREKLSAVVTNLASKLAEIPDASPEGDALATLFHDACLKLQIVEAEIGAELELESV
jgi:hypothetical protein